MHLSFCTLVVKFQCIFPSKFITLSRNALNGVPVHASSSTTADSGYMFHYMYFV